MMIRLTFINLIIFIWASKIQDSTIERKINENLKSKTILESALLLDPKTFVSFNGLRSNSSADANNEDAGDGDPSKGNLRLWPKYYLPVNFNMSNIIMDLMRQSVYTTQEKMQDLEPILKKYENHPSLRMAFIYNRLRQLIIDMRRLYTLSSVYKKDWYHPVYQHMFWYSHIVRKYFDVLYIVEHVIVLFNDYVAKLKPNDADTTTTGKLSGK